MEMLQAHRLFVYILKKKKLFSCGHESSLFIKWNIFARMLSRPREACVKYSTLRIYSERQMLHARHGCSECRRVKRTMLANQIGLLHAASRGYAEERSLYQIHLKGWLMKVVEYTSPEQCNSQSMYRG